MEQSIKINDDIRLIQIRGKIKQAKLFFQLLLKNKDRLEPFFPGYYKQSLSEKNVLNLLERKEKQRKNNEAYCYLICSRKAKKIIGEIFIHKIKNDAYISYWIDKHFEKMGIINTSFDILRTHIFKTNIHTLCASCDITNEKSIQFLKQKGFIKIATYKNSFGKQFIDFIQSRYNYLSNS